MAYMIECTDHADSLSVRQENRPDHLAYLTSNADRLLLAGAKWADDGETPIGSVLIVDVETREEAEAFAAADPFSKAGLFSDVKVTNYRVAFLDRASRLPS